MRIQRQAGALEVRLERGERRALLGLLDQLEPLVESSKAGNPSAYEDPGDDQEYRRLALPELQARRKADINVIRGALNSGESRLELSPEAADCWLRALNLMRLALAEEIGITEDGWEERFSPQEHRRQPLVTLHTLTWIQDALLEAATQET